MWSENTKYFEYGQEEIDYLISADEILGAAVNRIGKLERVVIPDLFAALVNAIVGQLISVKAANTIWTRLQERLGKITPENMSNQKVQDIQACGITMKKAVCIHDIANLITQGVFRIEELHNMTDTEVVEKLVSLKGIGRWTAEMLLLFAMERRDVVSWGDIAIRRGMMRLYGLSSITKDQFEQYRLRYSPLGSVASIYLWEIASEKSEVIG